MAGTIRRFQVTKSDGTLCKGSEVKIVNTLNRVSGPRQNVVSIVLTLDDGELELRRINRDSLKIIKTNEIVGEFRYLDE
jgi:hypothetical protein